jgi:scyllo-inositol 2-dehydrogenase (NADP+)
VRSQLWENGIAAQVRPRFHVLSSTSAYTSWGLDPQEPQLKDGVPADDPSLGVRPEEAWARIGVDGDTRPVPTRRGDYAGSYAALAAALQGDGPLRDSVAVIRLIEEIHASVPMDGSAGRD